MTAVVLQDAVPVVKDPSDGNEWAKAINHCYGCSVLAVIETGRHLLEAKKALPHGEWGRLFDQGVLRFSERSAQNMMAIASHERLGNPQHVAELLPSLPNAYSTLVQLTSLTLDQFDACVESGEINPEMRRSDASTLRRKLASGGAVHERVANTGGAVDDEETLIETARQRFDLLFGDARARAVAPSAEPAVVAVACMVGGSFGANFADMWDADNMKGQARVIARDARSAALYVLHIGLGISQPRCAAPFGLESSAVSRIAQRVTDWREEQHWDRLFNGLEEAAQALWDEFQEARAA